MKPLTIAYKNGKYDINRSNFNDIVCDNIIRIIFEIVIIYLLKLLINAHFVAKTNKEIKISEFREFLENICT